MAELADAPDLGSGVNRCAGSSPVTRTITKALHKVVLFVLVWFYSGLEQAVPRFKRQRKSKAKTVR